MWRQFLLLCMSLAICTFLGQCEDTEVCGVDVECYRNFGSFESYVSVLQNTLESLKSKLDEMQHCHAGKGSSITCPKCPELKPMTCPTCPDVTCEAVTCPEPTCQECPDKTVHPELSASSLPSDCSEYLQAGYNTSGIYKIRPVHFTVDEPIDVYCDMDTDGGGWTLFQRRDDYGEPRQDFSLGWKDYKRGFGNLSKEFWLGNDNLHALTNQKMMTLRIDLQDFDGVRAYAAYEGFMVRSEEQLYKATFWNFLGEAKIGDSMNPHTNNSNFSTKDRDNDNSTANCAHRYKGGWWFGSCHTANLNGLYLKGSHELIGDGIVWTGWKGQQYSLKLSEMKVRPKGFKPHFTRENQP